MRSILNKSRILVGLFSLVFACSISANAQLAQDTIPMDRSPMDVSYYPNAFPLMSAQNKVQEPLCARVLYSRPQKNGREIFGNIVKYGEVWRMGANEASEIDFFKDVIIGGKKIKKGRYSIFAITDTDYWTFIINADTDVWGAFTYNPKKDVVRVKVPVTKTSLVSENFTLFFEKSKNGFLLNALWDTVKVQLPVYLQ